VVTSDDLLYRVKQRFLEGCDRIQTFPQPPSPTTTNLTRGIKFLFVGQLMVIAGGWVRLLGASKLISKCRQGKLCRAVRKGRELQEVTHEDTFSSSTAMGREVLPPSSYPASPFASCRKSWTRQVFGQCLARFRQLLARDVKLTFYPNRMTRAQPNETR